MKIMPWIPYQILLRAKPWNGKRLNRNHAYSRKPKWWDIGHPDDTRSCCDAIYLEHGLEVTPREKRCHQ